MPREISRTRDHYLRLATEARLNGDMGEVKRLRDEYRDADGVSHATACAVWRKAGLAKPRKARADKGKGRIITADHVEALNALEVRSERAQKHKVNLPRTTAVGYLEEQGVVPKASASTWARAQKRTGFTMKHGKWDSPSQIMRSLGPCDVFLVDASQPVQYYPAADGKVELNVKRGLLEYKSEKRRDGALKRYLVVDHSTNAIWAYYAFAKGENAHDFTRALWEAMRYKGEDIAMGGIPRLIYSDPGSALTSQQFKSVFEPFGCELKTHEPGRARSKGGVEVANVWWEAKFEMLLIATGVRNFTLEELNQRAWATCARRNREFIIRRLNPPAPADVAWRRYFANHAEAKPLVYPPDWDVVANLMRGREYSRVVNSALRISLDRNSYCLKSLIHYPEVQKDQSIRISKDPLVPGNIVIFTQDGARHSIPPESMDEFGKPVSSPVYGINYKAQPDDAATKAYKHALKTPLPQSQEEQSRVVAFGPNAPELHTVRDGQALRAPTRMVTRAAWWDAYCEAWGVDGPVAMEVYRRLYRDAPEGKEQDIGVAWHEDEELSPDYQESV